jgi:hypothetical protein
MPVQHVHVAEGGPSDPRLSLPGAATTSRAPRRWRTGRNTQLNLKVSADVLARFAAPERPAPEISSPDRDETRRISRRVSR